MFRMLRAFVCFKQKTAYEMRISDGSSDVCASDLAAAVDLAFLVLLLAAALREIIAGRNWRNLPVTLALLSLIAANALMHLEATGLAEAGSLGERLGIATLAMLIGLIGGRVIPSFTRNWLSRSEEHTSELPSLMRIS